MLVQSNQHSENQPINEINQSLKVELWKVTTVQHSATLKLFAALIAVAVKEKSPNLLDVTGF